MDVDRIIGTDRYGYRIRGKVVRNQDSQQIPADKSKRSVRFDSQHEWTIAVTVG